MKIVRNNFDLKLISILIYSHMCWLFHSPADTHIPPVGKICTLSTGEP